MWLPFLPGCGVPGEPLPPLLEIPEQGTSLEEIEKELVQLALHQTRGNQTRAARLLDISRDALRYRIKKFGLGENEPYTKNGLAG